MVFYVGSAPLMSLELPDKFCYIALVTMPNGWIFKSLPVISDILTFTFLIQHKYIF